MKIKFFLSLFLLVSHVSFADQPKLWVEHGKGLFCPDKVTDGKTHVRSGFFGLINLRSLVKDNPTALEMVDKQSHFTTAAHLSYWIGVIPSAIGLGIGVGMRDSITTYVSAGTLIVTSFLTGHFVGVARHYMFEAINIYNGVPSSENAAAIQNQEMAKPQLSMRALAPAHSMSLSFNF